MSLKGGEIGVRRNCWCLL